MSDIFMDSDGHIIRNSMVDEHSIIKITEKVPDAKNIGKIICGETNSNILTFEMNRFYDNVDLITKNIKFIIKTPSFGFDDYASNVQHNSNILRFSWVVPYSATQEAGNVNVAIEFFDDSYSLKTMPFIIKVDKSINSEETQLEVPTNWYISIESRILQLENKTNENIADVVEDYMNEHPVQAVSDEHITEVAIASFGNDDFNTAVDTQVNAYLDESDVKKEVFTALTQNRMGFDTSTGEVKESSYSDGITDYIEIAVGDIITISAFAVNNATSVTAVTYDSNKNVVGLYNPTKLGLTLDTTNKFAQNVEFTIENEDEKYIRVCKWNNDAISWDFEVIRSRIDIKVFTPRNIEYGNVLPKQSEVDETWENWADGSMFAYGFPDKTIPSIYKMGGKGALYNDGMYVAQCGNNTRWNQQNFPNGGHVFEGWNVDRSHRLTLLVLQPNTEEIASCGDFGADGLPRVAIQVFDYANETFGWTKVGSDSKFDSKGGWDFTSTWAKAHTPVTFRPQAAPSEMPHAKNYSASEVADGTFYVAKDGIPRLKINGKWYKFAMEAEETAEEWEDYSALIDLGYSIRYDGTVQTSSYSNGITEYIPVTIGDTVQVSTLNISADSNVTFACYDKNKEYLGYLSPYTDLGYTINDTTKYLQDITIEIPDKYSSIAYIRVVSWKSSLITWDWYCKKLVTT